MWASLSGGCGILRRERRSWGICFLFAAQPASDPVCTRSTMFAWPAQSPDSHVHSFLPSQGSDCGPAWNTQDTLPVLTGSVPGGEATPTVREMTDISAGTKGNSEEKSQGHFPGPPGKENTCHLQPPPATSSCTIVTSRVWGSRSQRRH